MKTIESKIASTVTRTKTNPPFLSKEGEGNFFVENEKQTRFFFQPSAGYSVYWTSFIQPKLTIQSDDEYEKEADAMADEVIQAKPLIPSTTSFIQRKCTHFEEEKQMQHKEAGNDTIVSDASAENYISSLNDKGQPLTSEEKRFFEPRFGSDFSNVRLHTDSKAAESAGGINALAYTYGNNIVFGPGQHQPHTKKGRSLMAHELTHVVQQKETPGIQCQKKPATDDEKKERAIRKFDIDRRERFSYYFNKKKLSVKFDKRQQKAISAIRNGTTIVVTLGEAYLNESDYDTRYQWIKTEVIDKYIPVDRFEDLAYDPFHLILHQINPSRLGIYCNANCPATASALAEYLKTGKINPAICHPLFESIPGYGFDISMNTFTRSFTWRNAKAIIKRQLNKHGEFVTVEARRSKKQMNGHGLTEFHYFNVVNIKGKLFAIDAFGQGIVNDDLDDYISHSVIATSYKLVMGQFKVKEYIPK